MRPTRPGRRFVGKLVEHESKAGRRYWKAWSPSGDLIGFDGPPDEQGRRTLDLWLDDPRPSDTGPRAPVGPSYSRMSE